MPSKVTKAEVEREFRNLWEGEILDQAGDNSALDDLLWFWDSWVFARVEDKTLPERALSWKAPTWLAKLDNEFQQRKTDQ
jgi:hypothetical protein